MIPVLVRSSTRQDMLQAAPPHPVFPPTHPVHKSLRLHANNVTRTTQLPKHLLSSPRTFPPTIRPSSGASAALNVSSVFRGRGNFTPKRAFDRVRPCPGGPTFGGSGNRKSRDSTEKNRSDGAPCSPRHGSAIFGCSPTPGAVLKASVAVR